MLRRHWSARRCGHKSKEMCRSASCPAFHHRKAHAPLRAGFPSAISRHSAFGGRWAATTAAPSQMQGRHQSRQMISHCAGCTNTPFTLLCVYEYMLSVSIQISLLIGFSTEGNRPLSFPPSVSQRTAPACSLEKGSDTLRGLVSSYGPWSRLYAVAPDTRLSCGQKAEQIKKQRSDETYSPGLDRDSMLRHARHGARIGKDEPWY